jgi:protein MpaA
MRFAVSFLMLFFFYHAAVAEPSELAKKCVQALKAFPGKVDTALLERACEKVQVAEGCTSVNGAPIYHYEKSASNADAKKILVFSLIHGDETPAGAVGRYWMERLESFDPRNSWRVIPVLNPDGVVAKTRTNGNKIDLNRNFPTRDWEQLAQAYWKTDQFESPALSRRQWRQRARNQVRVETHRRIQTGLHRLRAHAFESFGLRRTEGEFSEV